MTDLIQGGVIGIGMDGSQVVTEVAKIEKSLANLGGSVKDAGAKSADGIDKIAKTASNSADAVDTSTKRQIAALQKRTAALITYGQDYSDMVQKLADLRKVDVNFDQALAQLKTAERQFKANQLALRGLDKEQGNLTKSTGQLNNALRNVPAQITDIVVSLQGGQRPLTVLLQQGGQLKDLFGGIVPAFKGLATGLLGLVTPFSVALGAVAGLTAAYAKGATESSKLNTALINTGNIAGTTAGNLNVLAGQVGEVTGKYGLAREAAQALAASGVVAGKDIPNALKGVVDAVTITGKSVQQVTEEFEKLTNEPLKGLVELNKRQNFLTADIYKQIEALEKQGKTQEAASLAIKTYYDTFSSRKDEVIKNLGIFEQLWRAVSRATGAAIDGAANFGRELSNAEKLKKVAQEYRDLLSIKNTVTGATTGSDAEIKNKLKELEKLSGIVRAENERSVAIQTKNKAENKKIELLQELQKQSKDANYLTKAEAQLQQVNALRAKAEEFKKTFGATSSEYIKAVQLADQAIQNLNDKANASAIKSANSEAKRRLEEERKAAIDAIKEQIDQELLLANEAGQAYEKALQDKARAQEQFTESLSKSLEATSSLAEREQQRVDEIQRQIDVFGLGEEAISALEAAKLRDAAATYEQSIAEMQQAGASKEVVDWTYAQIQALKDRAQAIEQYGKKSAELENLKQAKKAQDELEKEYNSFFERLGNNLSQAFTNGLFDSFKKGESFGKAMLRNLAAFGKTAFAQIIQGLGTNVLKNLFSGGGASVAGGIGALFSTGAQAAGAGSGSGVGGALSSIIRGDLSSITNLFQSGNSALVSSIESLGTFLSTGTGGLGDILGGALGQYAGTISNVLPFAGVGLQLLQGNVKGALGAGLGAALSFTPLGPVGGLIGSVIGGSLFGGKKQPPRTVTQLPEVNAQFIETLTALTKGFGLDSNITASARYSGRSGGSGYGFFDANVNGVALNEGIRYKGAYGEATMKQFIETVLVGNVKKAIAAINLPEGIKKFFTDLTKQEEIAATINGLVSLNAQLKNLPPVFDAIRTALNTTSFKISVDELQKQFSDTSVFTSLFYTAEEQFKIFTDQLTSQLTDLNQVVPKTRDEFRALVDGYKVTDEASSKIFGGLVALAPAMDNYFKQLETQKAQADALTNSLRDQNSFASLAEYRTYRGVAGNYGTNFALDYTANQRTGAISVDSTGEASAGGDSNLVKLLTELRDLAKQNLIQAGDTVQALQRFDKIGIPARA
jgi:phage-related minor tail protein